MLSVGDDFATRDSVSEPGRPGLRNQVEFRSLEAHSKREAEKGVFIGQQASPSVRERTTGTWAERISEIVCEVDTDDLAAGVACR